MLDAIEREFHFKPPRQHGLDVVDGIQAMHEGKIRVFFAMGGNFLSATPDTHFTAEGLERCELTVQVSTKLNRSHLITGKEAIILPCLARTDEDLDPSGNRRFITCENSMGVVQQSKGNLKPVSDHLLSEPEIVCRLGEATLGPGKPVDWRMLAADYDAIRNLIERTIPGFERYNERARERGGFYLPNSARIGTFPTASTGKANFTVSTAEPLDLEGHEFILMTVRSHDQFNTTIYGLDDRYRGVRNERRVVFLNEEDCLERGLKEGDLVDLVNRSDGRERVARLFLVIPYNIPRRCAATYFPEANVLVPIERVAHKSNTPTSKFVPMDIVAHQA